MTPPVLCSSPLQSFTDFRFRNAHFKYFGGVDRYFAPYIKFQGHDLDIKPVYQRDLLPENNLVPHLTPQVMCNSAAQFLAAADYVKSLGYTELNWNLGCPYPMVVNRGMGSGLICEPLKIKDILEEVHQKSDLKISMKMRLGYEDPGEILDTLEILEQFPIELLAVHARLGKQLYKGGVDWGSFDRVVQKTKLDLYYNGDIVDVASYRAVKHRFPSVNQYFIGRGLIQDPFLAQMIKSDSDAYPADAKAVFQAFHDDLFQQYEAFLSGSTNVIRKMYHFWEYFVHLIPQHKKGLKKMKKAKNLQDYHQSVSMLMEVWEK